METRTRTNGGKDENKWPVQHQEQQQCDTSTAPETNNPLPRVRRRGQLRSHSCNVNTKNASSYATIAKLRIEHVHYYSASFKTKLLLQIMTRRQELQLKQLQLKQSQLKQLQLKQLQLKQLPNQSY